MSEEPEPVRNRRGCFIIVALVAIAIALYALVGFSGNNFAHKIPPFPRGKPANFLKAAYTIMVQRPFTAEG
jgi:hypothetical protein